MTATTLYILPFFWILLYTFLCTNVLNMLNPSCGEPLDQDLLIEVDTSDELYSLTCLTLTLHQSALECMLYNGLLVVVVWVLLRKSTCFLLTILV